MGLMDSARGRLHLCDRMLLGQHGFGCPKPSLGEVLARCIQLVVKLRPIVDERSVGNDRPTVCIRLRRLSAVCQAGNRFRVMVGRLPESEGFRSRNTPRRRPIHGRLRTDEASLKSERHVSAPRPKPSRPEAEALVCRSGSLKTMIASAIPKATERRVQSPSSAAAILWTCEIRARHDGSARSLMSRASADRRRRAPIGGFHECQQPDLDHASRPSGTG